MGFSPFRLTAHAKLNLSLHITGKRTDGYHLLDSLVAFAETGDVLEFTPSEPLHFSQDGPFAHQLGAPVQNLAFQAALLLQQETNTPLGASITLTKTLPVGSGLGGGSADAAAVLRGLIHLWNLEIDDERLYALAARLGADVPACLAARPCRMSGIGERVTLFSHLPAWPLVLAHPGTPLLTKNVYHAFRGPYSVAGEPPRDNLLEWLKVERNDLEGAACSLMPSIGAILEALREREGCALARMSGSGAACFAIFNDAQAAEKAAQTIADRHPEWWVTATRLLGAD